MTVTERLYIYDTTLRDGQQTQGVTFSLEDKNRISNLLDNLGVDYIEGGWPGANPTDSDFFDQKNSFINAKLVAFGMTKRFGRSAENDEVLSEIVNSRTSVVCLVGKSHEFHVKQALGISLDENLELYDLALQESKVVNALGADQLREIFDYNHYIRHIDETFKNAGIK